MLRKYYDIFQIAIYQYDKNMMYVYKTKKYDISFKVSVSKNIII